MKRKIRELKIAGFAFLLFALFACGFVASAAEGTSITVDVAVQYGQTEAREMLDMINEFRASGAKCWDKTDTEEVLYTGLDALDYDYGLEQTAMQRAAEIALMFAHTRPNGEDCWTAYEGWQGAKAENIAAGSSTTEGAFEQWKEEGKPYKDQGHRRNMLNSSVKYIGIGHVIYNGRHFWVQEFGDQSTGVAAPAEADVEKQVPVEVLSSYITQKTVTPLQDAITLSYRDSSDLPEIDCKIQLKETWPAGLCTVTPDGASDIWTVSEGIGCIEIDEATNKIHAIGCGEAELKAEMLGQSCLVFVTVTPKDITDNAAVTLEGGPFSYTGNAIEPSVKVKTDDGSILVKDKDYELKYSDNVNAGTASVTVSGTGNYSGTCTATFEIARAGLLSEDCTFADGSGKYEYTGEEIRPAVVVKHGGRTLAEGKDYELSYGDNLNAEDVAVVSVSGKGNYDGTVSLPFRITPAELTEDNCIIAKIPDQEYTGEEIEPEIFAEWNGQTLSQDTDYTLAYSSNTEVGTAAVTIMGGGNFRGELGVSFKIVPANIGSGTLSVDSSEYTYTGEEICPEVTVKLGEIVLEQGVDYSVDPYENNINVGDVTVSVSGKGNYTGSLKGTFEILPLSVSGDAFALNELKDVTYTGSAIKPDVVLSRDGIALEEGTDFTVEYKNNTNAGTAVVTVTGMGNYEDTRSGEFTIQPVTLDDSNVGPIEDQTYTGSPIEVLPVVSWNGYTLVLGEDYELSYSDHVNVGTASIKISCKGNYSGTFSKTFRILPADIQDCQVSEIPGQPYTGEEIRPEVTVTLGDYVLKEGTDYKVTGYSDNVNIGEADITLEGLGNFAGEAHVQFAIVPIDLGSGTIQAIEDQTYTGVEICPAVTVQLDGKTLEKDMDYEVAYKNNVNAGTAGVTVMGKGNYSGSLAGTFVIAPREISESECTVGAVEDQTYTGAQIRPAVEVFWNGKELLQDTDYMITYDNNVNAGTANGNIKGTGNYSGAIGTVAFEILPVDLSNCTLDSIPEQTFTGAAVEPQITVRFGSLLLTKNTDFLAAYENNVAEGAATVVLTGTGNYTGTISGSFAIKAKPQQTPAPDSTQTPSTTPSQTPAPESTQTPGGAQPSRLAVGTVKKDSTSAAKYKVKGNASGVPTVEYVAPSNKKKTSIVVPNTVVIDHVTCKVTSIATNAFKNNKKVKKIVVGKYVTSIGKNAFRGCSKLKSVKMGARVTEIKDGAFYGCSALTSVEIPSTVTKIGKQAFYNCKKLKKITIKTKNLVLKKVGAKAFAGINSKAVIKVPGNKKKAYKTILRKRGVSAKAKIK